MLLRILALVAAFIFVTEARARCARFPESMSTAFDAAAGKITLPWRVDYPASPGNAAHRWSNIDFTNDWQAYMASVLAEVKDAGLVIENKKVGMRGDADWWISPWMDDGQYGRESLIGLTKERGPDPHDLSPTSGAGHQVWAIGWYNREGAYGLGQVFADACNPSIPKPAAGGPWTFPDQTASFKLLFTDATDVPYLNGAPVVEAMIDPPPGETGGRRKRELRLIQVDIAVRDPNAADTSWVLGTFVWNGPRRGDGLFDNLVPVGLMWGNDREAWDPTWANHATLRESRLNPALAGVVWQGGGVTWPQRPYPGFQGRVNGPADNLRSSCLSCHALAQWRRHPQLNILPRYAITPPPTAREIEKIVDDYFRNVKGGTLTDPTDVAIPLDYSLQLEAGFTRMCQACGGERMTGATPELCKAPGRGQITRATCERTTFQRVMSWITFEQDEVDDTPPRQ